MTFNNNFATSFRWCDRIMGTDKNYLRYIERVKRMRASNIRATQQELMEMEGKLMTQFEAAGAEEEARVCAKVGATKKID